jgi:hypothetical protein
MADQNPQQTESKAPGPASMVHPCNDPNLSPEEFPQRVMVDDTFSMALRVKAASALTAIQTKAPQPPITIRIKDPYCHEYLARFPWLKEFVAKALVRSTRFCSHFAFGAQKLVTHHRRRGTLYILRRRPIRLFYTLSTPPFIPRQAFGVPVQRRKPRPRPPLIKPPKPYPASR